MYVYLLTRTCLIGFLAVVCALAGQALAAPPGAPEITRFEANPVDTLAPGTELSFRLEGTPQGRATVTINGLKEPIALRETDAGWYEGSYTIRSQDRFPSNPTVSATLRRGNRAATSRLSQPLLTASRAPGRDRDLARDNDQTRETAQIRRVRPRDGERITQPVTISGTLDSNVDPRSVRIFLAEREVTQDATVTPSSFTYRPTENLMPGPYRVEVRSRDYAGNADRRTWTFEVQSGSGQVGPGQARRQEGFPLEVTSPRDMAEVRGGSVEIRGRSAPNLPLTVQVEATTSVGGLFGVNQNVMSRTVTTDDRGNFVFNFEPRLKVPGTQYEVNISGTMDGQEKSRKLTLVQK
jgi:hypothetical protein